MRGPVVVLGAGSTGEAFAAAVRRRDARVPIAVVERELVGGECSYYACMPTKALLRPAEALAAARLAPGAAEAVTGSLDAARVFWHRDQVTGNWDDSSQEAFLADRDIELIRGQGQIVAKGVVAVAERKLPYETLALATGSVPSIPPIPGLSDVAFWTNRDVARLREVPASVVVLGAGPVGAEMAQFLRRIGAEVAIADVADRLLPRDDPEAGAILGQVFADEGIDVHVGTGIDLVSRTADGAVRVCLADGSMLTGERLLVATGRRPNVDGLGLELLELAISRRGIDVDEHMRAAPGVYALGDVTGIAAFTHVGKYQARVAAADWAGLPAVADHRAVPAVTFTDPQVASVGRTAGEGLVSASWKVNATARASTYERPKRPGFVKVFADAERRVLVGAVAVGPEAGEWLGQLTLAVKAGIGVDVLRDSIQPYPTFSEAIFFAVRDLPF